MMETSLTYEKVMTTHLENAPPSPRSSVGDELVRDLDDQDLPMSKSTPDSLEVSLWMYDTMNYIVSQGWSLVYWEVPTRSGAVLACILGTMLMTQYYSLLYLVSAGFTIVTGVNWMYVNLFTQIQKIVTGESLENVSHPHRSRLEQDTWPLTRDDLDWAVVFTGRMSEEIVSYVARLVLIQDSQRSAFAVAISYSLWTAAKYIAVKHLVLLILLAAFSIPYTYKKNYHAINEYTAKYFEKPMEIVRQGSDKIVRLADQVIHQWELFKQQAKLKQ